MMDRNTIYTGDHAELANLLPDESIDFVMTDPPYPRDFLHVFYELGEYAPRILKPGGSLITLCGQYQVPMVIEAMKDLDFHWIGWLESAQKRSLFGYKIVCGGKPVLWFCKGKAREFRGFWWDTKKPFTGMDKRFHEWGQPIGYAIQDINLLTRPGELVLDPFVGGGTIPAACKILRRDYIGFEIDPDTAEIARKRVMEQNPPLFVEEPLEQANLWVDEEWMGDNENTL